MFDGNINVSSKQRLINMKWAWAIQNQLHSTNGEPGTELLLFQRYGMKRVYINSETILRAWKLLSRIKFAG